MIIPKVEIKVTANELKEAYAALDFDLPNIPAGYNEQQSRKLKNLYSLLEVVRIKLAKKVLSNKDKKKPFKLSFEHFEADCIHQTMMCLKLEHYAQNFFNKLDQKLA
ncbi:MAG TPA: hypothetical protein VFF15_08230 [Flavobacteriaceae bacterium]|nr:hypothetical protein [Flavobacteriaceae bacterium]